MSVVCFESVIGRVSFCFLLVCCYCCVWVSAHRHSYAPQSIALSMIAFQLKVLQVLFLSELYHYNGFTSLHFRCTIFTSSECKSEEKHLKWTNIFAQFNSTTNSESETVQNWIERWTQCMVNQVNRVWSCLLGCRLTTLELTPHFTCRTVFILSVILVKYLLGLTLCLFFFLWTISFCESNFLVCGMNGGVDSGGGINRIKIISMNRWSLWIFADFERALSSVDEVYFLYLLCMMNSSVMAHLPPIFDA